MKNSKQTKHNGRGRKPLPDHFRRRRIFVRLLLPPQAEWLAMLQSGNWKTQTDFFQEAANWFLASHPEGRKWLDGIPGAKREQPKKKLERIKAAAP